DAAVEEETIVEETTVEEEETVAESELEPTDADTIEAAEIETLSDDAVEASDTMDGEPVVEEPSVEEEETVADDATVEEEPVAEGEEFDTTALTIAELTGSSESFEILAAALAAADLTEVLAGEGPYTVFAPTDEAFEALPEELVAQLLEPENKDSLVELLTYHVVDGAVLSTDLEEGAVETLAGDEVTVSLEEGVTVNSSNVVFADVEASNGVIHVIDRVMMPGEPAAEVSVEDTIAPEESIAIDETEVEETVEVESTVEEMPTAE
ncbi:MAG: fasciclin domain-containing protein, partial [Cyanobacteria bacterium J06573_11]